MDELIENFASSTAAEPEARLKVRVVEASGSLAEIEPTAVDCSAIEKDALEIVGASLTFVIESE